MKRTILILFMALALISCKQNKESIEYKVNKLISEMTLEEKIGQLNQYSNPYLSTGAGAAIDSANINYDNMVRNGEVGSFLNVLGAEKLYACKKLLSKSRASAYRSFLPTT